MMNANTKQRKMKRSRTYVPAALQNIHACITNETNQNTVRRHGINTRYQRNWLPPRKQARDTEMCG